MNTKKTIRNKNPLLFLLIITFVIAYITYQLPRNLIVFNYGRSTAYSMDLGTNNIFLSSIISSIPLILPSIIAFYFKEIKKLDSLFKPILLSLPIFIVQFLGGTRFPLLFSMGGFFIIIFANKLNGRIRLNYKIITIGIVLLLITEIMTSVRVKGLGSEQLELIKKNETRISKVLASNMSPEGVINMTSLMMNHFDNNPHMYGKSASFIFYFWIPRSIWPDKPTMLGNWLIRKYQDGFSSVHSTSFGFTGDLYADFGYYSLFLIFILGIILRRLDIFFSLTLSKSGSYSKVFAAMLFPYTFFFVRSPITSTITFLGILLIYLLFRKIIFLKFK